MKIAQRFNAGSRDQWISSPGETIEILGCESFSRPYGTASHLCPNPALKRRAIFACPSGTAV